MKTLIVIPSYNQMPWLKMCVGSIRIDSSLARKDYDLVVVDDCSEDGSRSWLMHQEGMHKIYQGIHRGYAAACNAAASYLREHRYICFLNQDTIVRPGWLHVLTTTLECNQDAAAVQPKLLYPDGTIQSAGMVVYRKPAEGDLTTCTKERFYYRNRYKHRPGGLAAANHRVGMQCLTGACLLVQEGLFRAVGGFDEEYYNGHEDVDLCFKLLQGNFKLLYEPAAVVMHREGKQGSNKRDPERTDYERRNMLRCKSRWQDTIEPWYETLEEAETCTST